MGAEYEQIGGRNWAPSEDECGVDADSALQQEDVLSLPWDNSSSGYLGNPNLLTRALVERMPHASRGVRVFSRRGVMRRLACLAGCVALGMAFGCLTISGDQYADIPLHVEFLLIYAALSLLCIFVNGAKAHVWVVVYPVVACSNMTVEGVLLAHAFRYTGGVMVSAFVASLVLLIGCFTWCRSVSDRIRSRVGAWYAIASSVVLPSYGLCSLTGGDRLMTLLVCVAMGAVGAFGFMQNLWATDYCAADNRDARFEWHMAWLIAFNAFIVFVAIAREMRAASND